MKNLKMFAIALLAMLVMVCGVKAAENPCDEGKVYATVGSTSACYESIDAAIEAMDDDNATASIKLYEEVTLGSTLEIPTDRELTLDLNGNDITVKAAIDVKGSLTVKNSGTAANIETDSSVKDLATIFQVYGGASLDVSGKITLVGHAEATQIKNDAKAIIAVSGTTSAETNVTVANDVKVTTTGAGISVYTDNLEAFGTATTKGSSNDVKINVAGTWETDLYVIQVDGMIESSDGTVITVKEGKFTSAKTFAFYASGDAEWNITGGEITGADAIGVRSGKVTVSGTAKLTGTATKAEDDKQASKVPGVSSKVATGSAVRIINDTRGPITKESRVEVELAGGTYTTKSADTYAIYIDDASYSEEAKIAITNGSYASKGKTAAIHIGGTDAKTFLDNHESMITGGEFANAIIGSLNVGSASYPSDTVLSILAKGTDFKTEGGKVVVGEGNVNTPSDSTVDPGTQTPGEEQNPGNQGSTENVPNPNTNDNILVYAGLGLVSLASVAFTARKRED